MPKLQPLEDVTGELQAPGYAVSPDKLQRLRTFGIRSIRVGRRYYMSVETIRRLSYLLHVEKTFNLARNHNALALELACRAYPVIPWKRVHKGAQNGFRHFVSMIDRQSQRITGKRKSALTEQHIIKLSRQVARQLIPDKQLEEAISSGLSRELLERALEIVLRAAYLDQDARESDVSSILKDTGLNAEDALRFASLLTVFFNNVRTTLRMKDGDFFHAIREPALVGTIKTTVKSMRQLRGHANLVNCVLRIPSDPPIDNYPNFVVPGTVCAKAALISRALSYACTRWILNSVEGAANLERLASGELQLADTFENLGFIISAIPKTIGGQYA